MQPLLDNVNSTFADASLLNVTPMEYAIFQSPPDVLFDKSILQRWEHIYLNIYICVFIVMIILQVS